MRTLATLKVFSEYSDFEYDTGDYPGVKKEDSVKRELDSLVSQMHAGGITYDEAVREFKKRFILEVLSHHRGNQCKAAQELGMHRNTLSRTIAELQLDPAQIRSGLKRPVRSARPVVEQKQILRSS